MISSFAFGIPSVLAALIGAFLLNFLTEIAPLHTWQWGSHTVPSHR